MKARVALSKAVLLHVLALAVTGMSGIAAVAQEDCSDPEVQTTNNYCVSQAFWKLDGELGKVYEEALAHTGRQDKEMPPPEAPDLKTETEALMIAQKAWLQYRDAHCDGMGYKARGGSLEPVLVGNCKIDLTENRMKELKDLMTSLGN